MAYSMIALFAGFCNFILMVTKSFFKFLAAINKMILPKYSKRDINALSKIDKALVAYRYWVTIHAIDDSGN